MTATATETPPNTASPPWMEQRLDALDRALLGILPRTERLTLVTQVESRIRELSGGNPAAEPIGAAAIDQEAVADVVTRRATPAVPKRRSRLALSSGILGIVALVMLFAMPITYLLVVSFAEDFGEVISMGLLSIHILTVALGGLVALIMGIAGLVSLSRRKGRLVGHGWAITGLCTAPLPTLVGGLMMLVTGFSLFAFQSVTVESIPGQRGVAYSSSTLPYCESPAATCVPTTVFPPPSFPSTMPMPVSAAPSFGPLGGVCPSAQPASAYCEPAEPYARPTRIAPVAPSVSPGPYSTTPTTAAGAYGPAALPAPTPLNPTELTPAAPAAPAPTEPPPGAAPAKATILGPIVPGNPTEPLDPPSDDEILRVLENATPPVQGGYAFLHERERNNVRILKEKIADYVDPPRVVPLVGPVQLHHAHYKCTIYSTETTRVGWPVTHTLVDEDSREVVYIDHNHFHLVGNADTSAAATNY